MPFPAASGPSSVVDAAWLTARTVELCELPLGTGVDRLAEVRFSLRVADPGAGLIPVSAVGGSLTAGASRRVMVWCASSSVDSTGCSLSFRSFAELGAEGRTVREEGYKRGSGLSLCLSDPSTSAPELGALSAGESAFILGKAVLGNSGLLLAWLVPTVTGW